MWGWLFTATNLLALAGWAALLVLPRTALVRTAVMYLGVAMLCLIYAVCLALFMTGAVDPGAIVGAAPLDFTLGSIEAVRALFQRDGGVVIGWTHYLAFDLFVGLWIAADADNKGFSRWLQVPFLLATLLAGPVGLLAWLAVRERRARAAGRSDAGRGL